MCKSHYNIVITSLLRILNVIMVVLLPNITSIITYYYIIIMSLLCIITVIMSTLLRFITTMPSPLLSIITRSIIRNNGFIITYYRRGQLGDGKEHGPEHVSSCWLADLKRLVLSGGISVMVWFPVTDTNAWLKRQTQN